MKKILITASIVLSAISAASATDSSRPLTQNIHYTKLPNGLTVIVKEDHTYPLVGLLVGYKVGFRNEDVNGHTGLTHLLEHMLFMSTAHFTNDSIPRTLGLIGADYNGNTGDDATIYWEVMPASGLDAALSIEKDRMTTAKFLEKDLELQKKQVYFQLLADTVDPEYTLSYKLFQNTLGDHPLAFMSGDISDVTNTTADYLKNELYKKYYCPNNAIVVLAGDIDPASALDKIKKTFGGIPANPNLPRERPNPIQFKTGVDLHITGYTDEDFGKVLFKLPLYNVTDSDCLALKAIEMFKLIRGFSYSSSMDYGLGSIEYYNNPIYPAESVDKTAIKEIFDSRKKYYLDLMEGMNYNIYYTLFTLFFYERHGSYLDSEKFLTGMNNVTYNDVARVIDKYLTRTNSSSCYIVSSHRNLNIQSQQYAKEDFSKIVDYSFLSRTSGISEEDKKLLDSTCEMETSAVSNYLLAVKVTNLANGITVVYRPYTIARSTYISVGFDNAGSVNQNKSFQAATTMDMIFDGGPQSRYTDQYWNTTVWITKKLYSSYSVIDIGGVTENFQNMIRFLSLALTDRHFMPMILEEYKVKSFNKWFLDTTTPSVETFLNRYPSAEVLRANGSGLDYNTDKSRIASLNADDIEKFYTSFYRPENMVIVVVSDNSWEVVLKSITKFLGSWHQKPAVMAPKSFTVTAPANNVVRKFPTESMLSTFVLSSPLIDIDDLTNYTCLNIASQIFGANEEYSRMSRLNSNGIFNEGLSYTLLSGTKSVFTVVMECNRNEEVQALQLLLKSLDRFRTGGPTDRELLYGKMAMVNSVLNDFNMGSAVANTLLYYQLVRGSIFYPVGYIQLVHDLTSEQIGSAMQAYFPKYYFIDVLGKISS